MKDMRDNDVPVEEIAHKVNTIGWNNRSLISIAISLKRIADILEFFEKEEKRF